MASVDKRSSHVRNATKLPNPGPYIGRIVNNVDPMKQGSLEVELLRPVGNQTDEGRQLFIVRYLSPFYGVTGVQFAGNNADDFNETQKSYGFWAVPPDIGCLVMVIFVEGDPGQGFWFGCVQDAYMNHMIPGIAASPATKDKSKDHDYQSWRDMQNTQELYGDTFLPVGEINRQEFKSGSSNGSSPNPDVDANKKSVHPIAKALLEQGTLHDPVRGVYTSSARRESPSNVYGWSTPGPRDRRQGAKKGKIGRKDAKVDTFVSRMGGHCIVMDDGDERYLRKTRPWEGPPEYADQEAGEEGLVNYPKDEAFRIRTRTGHQFLMHNAEDLIYLTNSRGTAWMEFTSNGKINFYAKEGVHFGSESDFTVNAGRDVAMHGQRDTSFTAAATQTFEAGNQQSFASDGHIQFSAMFDFAARAGNLLAMASDHGLDLSATRVNFGGSGHEWVVDGNLMITAHGNLEMRGQNVLMTADSETHITSGAGFVLMSRSLDLFAKSNVVIETGSGLSLKGNALVFEASGFLSAKSGGALGLQSGGEMHMLSGAGVRMTAGGAIGIGAKGNIVQKGAEIHLNGPAPATALESSSGTPAREALEAHFASRDLAGAAHAGGSYSSGVYKSVYHPKPGVGHTPIKYVPHKEPFAHEHDLPEGQTSALTDRTNPSQVYGANTEYRHEVNYFNHFEDVSALAGGTKDGHMQWASFRSGRSRTHDYSQSRLAKPTSPEAIEMFVKDWTKDKEFLQEAQSLAGEIGIQYHEALAIMYLESHCDPHAKNGSHTGLIQMGDKEARDCGTSTGALMRMSRVEQMKFVKQYFKNRVKQYGQPKDVGAAYMLVALPAWSNKPEDQPLATNKKGSKYKSFWDANPAWRDDKLPGAPVTRRGIKNAIQKTVEEVKAVLGSGQNKSGTPSPTTPTSSPTSSIPKGPTPGGINPK